MPVARVNDADIAYEIIGSGPLLVWTEGGRFGRNKLSYLIAGHFQSQYSVLLWDRRNTSGASEIALSDDPWYVMTDADDLAALLLHIDRGPAHLMGGSAGTSASLLLAHQHPSQVRSLVLVHPPTDDMSRAAPFAESWRLLADEAEQRGMQGVIDASQRAWDSERQGETSRFHTWPAESIHTNPANRERLLAMDVGLFATTMRRWAEYVQTMSWPPGLTEADLQGLQHPTMIVPGRDAIHPPAVAQRLNAVMPQSRLVGYPDNTDDLSTQDRICTLFPAIDLFLSEAGGE